MDQNQIPSFLPWTASGAISECLYEIGSITYDLKGALMVELLMSSTSERVDAVLSFEAPLAVRIVQEGSLMHYWNAGFTVQQHNIFVAKRSQFLDWLNESSDGVHSINRTSHFAVFTDDVCIEVLTVDAPVIKNL